MSRFSIEYLIEKLKKARQEEGLSQRALGKKIGVPQSHISKIENGLVDLQASSLIELARALNLELVLISRTLIPTVKALQRGGNISKQRPMYSLDDEDEDEE